MKLRMMAGKALNAEAYRSAKIKNDQLIGDMRFEEFLTLVSGLSKSDVVISFIGGNQHAVLSTIQHPEPFDFQLMGADVVLTPGADAIPQNVMKDYLSSGIAGGDGQRLKELRQATVARFYHVIPPPPKESAEHILRHHETHFAKQEIITHGISPATLRYKTWELQARLLEEFCCSNDIETIRPPAQAVTSDGFLMTSYYAQDATHANSDYGELLLRRIDDLTWFGGEA